MPILSRETNTNGTAAACHGSREGTLWVNVSYTWEGSLRPYRITDYAICSADMAPSPAHMSSGTRIQRNQPAMDSSKWPRQNKPYAP
jgi:hypothetical protein